MFNHRLFLLCCFFPIISRALSAADGKPCATPGSKEGLCVPLEDCPELNELLHKDNLNPENVTYLQLAQCGEDVPRVCCQQSNQMRPFKVPQRTLKEPDFDFRIGVDNSDVCGEQNYLDDKIIGVLAALDEFPWMALLKYQTQQGYGYGCGGSLLNRHYVLTAAHCIQGKFGAPVEVTLGEYDINTPIDCVKLFGYEECAQPVQTLKVKEAISHPQYVKGTPEKLHDIGLLKLETPATYTDFIIPICLPNAEIQTRFVQPEVVMQVAGWGRTRNRPASNVKRKARVPIVDRDVCSQKRDFTIPQTQICAGGGREDSCTGDSGGPLMARRVDAFDEKWYVAGIVSFGPKNCSTLGVPAVYTNVASYLDWIKTTIKT